MRKQGAMRLLLGERSSSVLLLLPLLLLVLDGVPVEGEVITINPATQGGIRDKLVAAQPGDVLKLDAGNYIASTSCGLVFNTPGVTLTGPEDASQRAKVYCISHPWQRFASISAPDVTISNLEVVGFYDGGSIPPPPGVWDDDGGTALDAALKGEDANFGGCFLVEGGGQGATLRDLTVGGCGMGAIAVQGASNVRLTGLNIEEKNGPALVARKGSAVNVSGAEINQLPPPPERFLYSWSLLCSNMTEAECAVLRPVPAFNETLCHASSMVQDEHDEEEHEEEEHDEEKKFRMCPGTTKDMCIMQGELTSSISLGELSSGHQHDKGANQGSSCQDICASLDLFCVAAWLGSANSCAPVSMTERLSCQQSLVRTNGRVCTCVRKGVGVLATAAISGSAIVLQESHFEISSSVISGSAMAGISSQNSSINSTDCTFKDGMAGVIAYDSKMDLLRGTLEDNYIGIQAFDHSVTRIAHSIITGNKVAGLNFHDSQLEMTSSEVSRNVLYGLHLHGMSASIIGCTFSENMGRGFVCENSDHVDIRQTSFSLNQDGAMLTEKCTVDIDGVSFSENTALGSGAAIRASKGSSISMRNFAAMSNRAEIDGGGVYYDASDGGSFAASYGLIQGNSAKVGRGGGMILKRFEATAVTIALTKEYGKVTGAVTNGTHMFFLSQSYVFAMAQVMSGPGRGSISVLSGVMGVPGYRDGQQNSASPPLYLHASRSAFVMSPDMTKIYYCEKFSGSIRVISVATGDSSTIAGGQGQQGFVRDGIGGAAVFIGPMSAVFDTRDDNTLFLVDSDPESPELGGSIRRLDVRNGSVTTILPPTRGNKDGPFAEAQLNSPEYITMCHNGALFVSESGVDELGTTTYRIRAVKLIKKEVATIAGSSVEECTEECPGDKTKFERILGMTINKQGNTIYVADTTSVRTISMEYKFVRTLIGTSMSGNADGSSESAAFSMVTGLTMSPDFKSIYFSDWFNMRLVEVKFPNPVHVDHVALMDNTAYISGGGIHFSHIWDKADGTSGLRVTDASLSGNVAESGHGGGVFVSYTEQVVFQRCKFEKNKAAIEGGAVHLTRVGLASLNECNISAFNTAHTGSAIFSSTSLPQLVSSSESEIEYSASADTSISRLLWGKGQIKVENSEISGNSAVEGTVVCFEDSLFTISGANITGNRATNGAGIIVSRSCALELVGGDVSGNVATGNGGGIHVLEDSIVKIAGTNISHNKASVGGGIVVSDASKLTLEDDVAFTGNSADSCGAAIGFSSSLPVSVTGSVKFEAGLVKDESQTGAGGGGAVCVYGQKSLDTSSLTHCSLFNGDIFPFSGDGIIKMNGNKALRGGGDIFFNCLEPPSVDMTKFQQSIRSKVVCGLDSQAGYGNLVAFPPSRLVLQEITSRVIAGGEFFARFIIVDALSQQMRLEEDSSSFKSIFQLSVQKLFVWDRKPSVDQHTVDELIATGVRASEVAALYSDALISNREYLFTFTQSDEFTIFLDGIDTSWPYRSHDLAKTLYLFFTVEIRTGNPEKFVRIPTVAAPIHRNTSLPGSKLVRIDRGVEIWNTYVEAFVETRCPGHDYSILENSFECHRCPAGATCQGGHFRGGKENTSSWVPEDGKMRLVSCSLGHILVRDEANPAKDECILCPDGTFIDKEPDYATGFLVTDDPAIATSMCKPCFPGFYCYAGWETHPIRFQIFPANRTEDGDIVMAQVCIERMQTCSLQQSGRVFSYIVVDFEPEEKLDSPTRRGADLSWIVHSFPDMAYGESKQREITEGLKQQIIAYVTEGQLKTQRRDAERMQRRDAPSELFVETWPIVYEMEFTIQGQGAWVFEVLHDNVQLQNSPFVLSVLPVECEGDNRVDDGSGYCVCGPGFTDFAGICVSTFVLIICIVVPVVSIVGIINFVYGYIRHTRMLREDLWRIEPDEIVFSDAPKVLGQGSFGWVVKAQYRGTAVAVKRLYIPGMKVRSGRTEASVGKSFRAKESFAGSDSNVFRGAASSIKGGVWTRPSESLTGSIKGGIWSRPSASVGSFGGGSNAAEKMSNAFAALSTPRNLVRKPSFSGHMGSKSDFTNKDESHDSGSGSSKRIGRHVLRQPSVQGTGGNVVSQKGSGAAPGITTKSIMKQQNRFSRLYAGAGSVPVGLGSERSLQDGYTSAGRSVNINETVMNIDGHDIVSESRVKDKDLRRRSDGSSSSGSVTFGCFECVPGIVHALKMRRQKKEAIQAFLGEIRTISRLRHPNICLVLGAVLSKDEPMLVMEHMEHGSLYDVLHNETAVIDGFLLKMIVSDIIQGMLYISSFSPPIVHGDLKARNILIDSTFRGKVTDFGLSQHRKAGAGTPYWMAPELIQGEEATVASDVYAFGITLFEIFTREEPFKGQEFRDVLTKLIDNTAPEEDARPKLPDDMPKNISNTIRKCWAQLPSWRPTFRELLSWISEIGLEDANDARADQPFGRNRLITSKRDSDSMAQDLYERFPRAMANAILAGRKPTPEKFECASIFSAEIEGFSEISQTLSADEITDLFHRLFSHFDELSSDFGVFKVETIGVSYVAVTNLVEEQSADHAERIAKFALCCLEVASRTYVHKDHADLGRVAIRIGIHSGPVVASVMGPNEQKFSMFGETVNVATRLQNSAHPNTVHVSKATALLILEQCSDVGIIDGGVVEFKGNSRMRTYIVVPDEGTDLPASLLAGHNQTVSAVEIRGDGDASGGSVNLSNYMMSYEGASIVSDAKSKGGSSGMFMKGITAFLRNPFSDHTKIGDLPIKYAEVYNAMALGIEDEQNGSMGRSSSSKKREHAKGTKANGSKHVKGSKKVLSQGVPKSDAKQNWSSAGSLRGASTADHQDFLKGRQKSSEHSRAGRTAARNQDTGASKGVRSWSPESIAHSVTVLGHATLGGNQGNTGLSSLRLSGSNGSSLSRIQQLLQASEIQWEYASGGDDSSLISGDGVPAPPPLDQRSSFKLGSGIRLEAMIVEDGENDAGSEEEEESGEAEDEGLPDSLPVQNGGSWRSTRLSGDPTSELDGSEEGSQTRSRSSTMLDVKRDSGEDTNAQSMKDILLGF